MTTQMRSTPPTTARRASALRATGASSRSGPVCGTRGRASPLITSACLRLKTSSGRTSGRRRRWWVW